MKVALLSLAMQRYKLPKIFEVAGYYGYDGVEIWGGRPQAYPYDMDDARCEEVLKLKEKWDLEVSMYTPEVLGYPYNIASPDKKERQETIDYLKYSIDVAKKIETPRVQLAVGHAGYDQSRKENFDNVTYVMKELADYAEKKDIDLIIEAVTIMESNVIAFLADLVDLLDAVDSPRVKTMIDTVTPVVHWETFTDYFEKLGDKMEYVHFIGSDGASPAHLKVTNSVIPMDSVLQVFKKYGYDGWLSSELGGAYLKDPELHFAEEIKNIRGLLDANGIPHSGRGIAK